LTVSQIVFSSLNARSSSGGIVTASKIPSLEAKKLFESFEVTDASVQQTAGTQSFFFSPPKVVFYRYYAIYELRLQAAVIKVIPFDLEHSGASIAVIGSYVGQVSGPESPCIVSFPSAKNCPTFLEFFHPLYDESNLVSQRICSYSRQT
jgi:hypothetical protein